MTCNLFWIPKRLDEGGRVGSRDLETECDGAKVPSSNSRQIYSLIATNIHIVTYKHTYIIIYVVSQEAPDRFSLKRRRAGDEGYSTSSGQLLPSPPPYPPPSTLTLNVSFQADLQRSSLTLQEPQSPLFTTCHNNNDNTNNRSNININNDNYYCYNNIFSIIHIYILATIKTYNQRAFSIYSLTCYLC